MLSRIRSWPPEVLVAWAGFALLLLFIVTSPHRTVYDEVAYLSSVDLLNRTGFNIQFLRGLPGHAGPLYTLIQRGFEPLTHLHAPWVRLINPVLFLGAVRLLATQSGKPHLGAQLLGCPFIGMSIAMALTEMPAFFFICGALWLLQSPQGVLSFEIGWGRALLAGLCCGLAILGRQTYAVMLPAFLILIAERRQAVALGWFLLAAFAVFGPVFLIWGGPIPPSASKVTTGFAWDFAALAFAYAGFATLFLAPRFLLMPWKWMAVTAIAAIGFNSIFHFIAYAPGIGLTSRLFSMDIKPLQTELCSAPLIVLAALTGVACVRAGWKFRDDRVYLFHLASSLLLFAVCAKMSVTFSSRYVVCALPFFLFVLEPYFDAGKARAWRFVVAGGLNLLFPLAYWYR